MLLAEGEPSPSSAAACFARGSFADTSSHSARAPNRLFGSSGPARRGQDDFGAIVPRGTQAAPVSGIASTTAIMMPPRFFSIRGKVSASSRDHACLRLPEFRRGVSAGAACIRAPLLREPLDARMPHGAASPFSTTDQEVPEDAVWHEVIGEEPPSCPTGLNLIVMSRSKRATSGAGKAQSQRSNSPTYRGIRFA